MRVSLATHGGFAAGINLRQPPTVVDTADLPPEKSDALARLVDAVASDAPTRGPGRARDAMSYTIVVDDGPKPRTLTHSDSTMSPEFAALLDWIRDHAPLPP